MVMIVIDGDGCNAVDDENHNDGAADNDIEVDLVSVTNLLPDSACRMAHVQQQHLRMRHMFHIT